MFAGRSGRSTKCGAYLRWALMVAFAVSLARGSQRNETGKAIVQSVIQEGRLHRLNQTPMRNESIKATSANQGRLSLDVPKSLQQNSKKEGQSTSGSAPKSIQVDSKSGRVIARMQGKRQVDANTSSGGGPTSRRNEDPWFLDQTPYPLQPYRFVYNVKGRNGQTEQYRQEVGDGKFLSGSYGYVLPDGIYRHVDYVADDRGFRAFIRTSEPGTANQNPANVVIASNPVSGGQSSSGSSFQSPTAAQQNLLATTPLLPAYTPGLYDYSTLNSDRELTRRPPGSIVNTPLRNFSSLSYNTTPPPQLTSQLVTPSTFNPALFQRDSNLFNNTSNLSSPPRSGFEGNQVGQTDNWSQSQASINDDLFGRIQPLKTAQETSQQQQPITSDQSGYNRFNYLGNLQPVEVQANGRSDQRLSTQTTSDRSSSSASRGPPSLDRASNQRTGATNRLAYDLPFSNQGGPLYNKLSYDNNHIFHPDLPYLSLERARSLAQLDQLNAAGPVGLHYIRPLLSGEPGTLTPLGSRQTVPSTGGAGPSSHFSSSSSGYRSSKEEEEHHKHRHEQSQDGSGGPTTQSGHEHHSGTKSGSVRQFEEHSSSPPSGNHLQQQQLPPPPPYQSGQHLGLQRGSPAQAEHVGGALKGGGRLQAPYAGFLQSRSEIQPKQLSQEASLTSRAAFDEPRQRLSSPVPPEPPSPPTPPTPPTPPEEPSTPSSLSAVSSAADIPAQQVSRSTPSGPPDGTPEPSIDSRTTSASPPPTSSQLEADQQQSTSTKGVGQRRSQQTVSWLGNGASSPAPTQVRSVRMPEDYRSSVMMNDLRSMQNTFGLPQPPRLQRASSFGNQFNAGEDLLNEERGTSVATARLIDRLRRVNDLIGPSHSSQAHLDQQVQSSGQQREELENDQPRRKQWAPAKPLATAEESRRLQTGPLLKIDNSQSPAGNDAIDLQSSLLLLEGIQGANESSFDARRLSAGASKAKLQAEKVSELEKFQQRLRTQQLLLEHTKSPEKPTSNRLSANKARLAQQLDAEMNSFVKYDEDLADSTALSSGNATAARGRARHSQASAFGRARRQDEQTEGIANGSRQVSPNTTTTGESEPAPQQISRRKLTIVQHSLPTATRSNDSLTDHQILGEKKKLADFAQQIKNWPSLQQQTSKPQQPDDRLPANELNTINDTEFQSKRDLKNQDPAPGKRLFEVARQGDSISKEQPNKVEAPSASSNKKPAVPANTINLDFINSVTALSVDHMNPFALASVNPAVQRSHLNPLSESLLSQHQRERRQQQTGAAQLLENADKHRSQGTGGGQPIGVATASARYFSSPDLLAAVNHHDQVRDLRSLLPDSAGVFAGAEESNPSGPVQPSGWASNHRLQAAAAGQPPYTYVAPAGAKLTSNLNAKDTKLVGSLSLFSANHNKQQQTAPSGEQRRDGSNAISRDGFEIRDRAVQVDNHRFYEVVSSGGFRQPNEESTGFQAFRGAPSLACMSLRPFHGMHRAKPASSSQFFITQSSYSYPPGQTITVNITTHSTERYFRGFMIQAYDPITGSQIGHFLPSNDSRPIDSCSASTHKNNLNKHHIMLTWQPPAASTGFGGFLGDNQATSTANQWLGLRNPIEPILRINVNNRKRQIAPPAPAEQPAPQADAAAAPAPAMAPVAAPAPAAPGTEYASAAPGTAYAAGSAPSPSGGHATNGLHQVKFRGTLVVTYEEFYCGFESSDQRFDKFDYAPKPAAA